jgi:hypothetical protein
MFRSSWGLIRPLRERTVCLCLFILTPSSLPERPCGLIRPLQDYISFSGSSETFCTGYSKIQISTILVRYERWSTVMGEKGLKVDIIPEALRRRRLQTSWICLLRADIFSSKPGLQTNKIQIRNCMYLSQFFFFFFIDARYNCRLSFSDLNFYNRANTYFIIICI